MNIIIMNIIILIFGVVFTGILIKMIKLYYNFYNVCKQLDTDERIKFFYNKFLVNIISKFNITKNIFIFYILIPTIKINYFILSIFISLIHSLCEFEYDLFMKKNGFSITEYSYQEMDKILNDNEDNKFNEINNFEFNQTCENNNEEKERLIDLKIEFFMKNKANIDLFKNTKEFNIEDFNLNNQDNNIKLENLIKNELLFENINNHIMNNIMNDIPSLENVISNMHMINEGIEVLRIDDIDFGDNINVFLNNFNEKNNKNNLIKNSENIVIIKTGKKKNKI
jgi:hypothetical protein